MISVQRLEAAGGERRAEPASGPASQPGQPPLRAGTYTVGALAAPAHSRNTLASTPSRPSRRARAAPPRPRGARRRASRSRRARLASESAPLGIGVVASMWALLRLCGLQASTLPGRLCADGSRLPGRLRRADASEKRTVRCAGEARSAYATPPTQTHARASRRTEARSAC